MTLLDRRYTGADTNFELVKAIRTLASDKTRDCLDKPHIDWLERKLKEIAWLADIVAKRLSADAELDSETAAEVARDRWLRRNPRPWDDDPAERKPNEESEVERGQC